MLLPDDSRAEFKALESALLEDLRPEGALQTLLAHRLVAAAWRLARADRLEFGLLIGGDPRESPGRALVRDGRAAAAFATLVRYRGGAQAELFRTLKALKELQAAAAAADRAADACRPSRRSRARPSPGRAWPRCGCRPDARRSRPFARSRGRASRIEAEPRRSRRAADADATRNEPERPGSGHRCATEATRNEPERPRDRNRQGLAAVSCGLPVDR